MLPDGSYAVQVPEPSVVALPRTTPASRSSPVLIFHVRAPSLPPSVLTETAFSPLKTEPMLTWMSEATMGASFAIVATVGGTAGETPSPMAWNSNPSRTLVNAPPLLTWLPVLENAVQSPYGSYSTRPS